MVTDTPHSLDNDEILRSCHIESVYANPLRKSEFANLMQGYFDK